MARKVKGPKKTPTIWEDIASKKYGVQWLIAVATFAVISAIMLSSMWTDRVDLAVGQVAPKDIQSPQRMINRYLTDALRDAEATRAEQEALLDPATYVIDEAPAMVAQQKIQALFAALYEAKTTDHGEDGQGADTTEAERVRSVLQRDGQRWPVTALAAATDAGLNDIQAWERVAVETIVAILSEEMIAPEDVPAVQDELGERIDATAAAILGDGVLAQRDRSFLQTVLRPHVVSNRAIDNDRLARVKDAAAREVRPVYVERGQMIVRQFDLVTEEHVLILQDLGMLKTKFNYAAATGLVVIVGVMIGLFAAYLVQKNGGVAANPRHVALLALLLVLVTALAKTASIIPFEAAGYLIPVALATMLIGILLDVHVAVVTALFLSVIVGMMMGLEFKYMLVALVGGMTGAFGVRNVSERSALTRAGLWVGIVTSITIAALGLFLSDNAMVKFAYVGIVNGVVASVGTIGFFAYLESLFGITSSLRLLELSNPNQPLLRQMLMSAPGTYHHSMLVGNLAESAVEAIGGDSLLTRVGAMYHDIGKTKRPYFFIENQYGGDNPHDKLSPTLSTLILLNHVRDGVEMAKRHQLPDNVTAFIREHHGTTLIRYFYHKAKENAKDEESFDEKDFRYPGPKPQSRESAVVLLADSVEAAVRSLQRATPDRLEALVRKIVKDYLSDGQLDESHLTLKDLDLVTDTFVQVLTGIYHKRVDYPEAILKEMKEKRV